VGKHHPDLYSCIIEFQKEQGYTEACVAEVALGKRIKTAPKKQWVLLQERIQDVALEYEVLDYLRTLEHNVNLT